MFYDALSRNTVKITLSEKDMREYSLKSDSISCRTAESKRTLTRFLKKFQSESSLFSGCSADRLFLEAFPSEDGGCVLYVSTLGTEKTAREAPARRKKQMCCAESLSDAAKLCCQLRGKTAESSLYKRGAVFCLIITAENDSDRAVTRLMEEYGEYSDDRTDIAFTEEHGKLICGKNAAEKLSELA